MSPTWKSVEGNLRLHVPSGIYHVRKFVKGKGRMEESTGETSVVRARQIAQEKISAWIGGKRKASGRKTISELCEELETQLDQDFRNGDRRRATCEKDRYYLKKISKLFGDIFADDINEEFWKSWVRTSGKALKIKLFDVSKYLSKVLTYAEATGAITRKPTIYNPDKAAQTGKVFTVKEIERFIKHAPRMLRHLFIIAAETGMRPNETQSLRWDWITFGKKAVTVSLPSSFTKTEQGRQILLSENAAQVLRTRKLGSVGNFVFHPPRAPEHPINRQYLWKLMDKLRSDMKLKKGDIKFHWLRHSFASMALLDKKMPLAEVAAYQGNSPGVLFKKYLAKDSSRTAAVSLAVSLKIKGEEE